MIIVKDPHGNRYRVQSVVGEDTYVIPLDGVNAGAWVRTRDLKRVKS